MTSTLAAPSGQWMPSRFSKGLVAGSRGALATVVAAILALLVWELTAMLSGGWVPSLWEIAQRFVVVLTEPATFSNMGTTLYRIGIAFIVSTTLGTVLGVAMGLNRILEAYFRPLIVIGLAIPDPVYIIFAILILGTEESSGIVALTLAVLPFVVTVVHSAVKAREVQLDDMARVYRFGSRRYLSEVLLGQIAPALVVASRTSFAFSWKIVVLVEALSQPIGVGSQIYTAFRLLRFDEMVAIALAFILVMRVIDSVVFGFLERKSLAWASN